jgi:mono/diheme cytochrome c family protein
MLPEVSMKFFGGYGWAASVLAAGISAAVLMSLAYRSITFAQTNSGANEKGEVERGRYLVEEVAKCAECHTPRNERGELKADAWLRGAPIWIKPVAPISNWADRAPALAGFPSFTEEQGERILEKGTGPEGEALRPPMHIYHMNRADAKAVITYLKSLPRGDRTN